MWFPENGIVLKNDVFYLKIITFLFCLYKEGLWSIYWVYDAV